MCATAERMAQIGESLPEPWYTLSQNAGVFCAYKRRCSQCKFIWATVEIPMSKKWPEHSKVFKCPRNRHHATKVADTELIADLERDDAWITPGRVLALRLGAVYRRRVCSRNKPNPYSPDQPCDARPWTTIEVMASGITVEDVAKCPVCKTFGRIFLREGKRYDRLTKGSTSN